MVRLIALPDYERDHLLSKSMPPLGRSSKSDKASFKNRYVTQLSNNLVNGKPIGGLGNAEAS